MDPGSSLSHSQVPTKCPCTEQYQSRPCLPIPLLKTNFNNILPFTPKPSKWSLSIRSPHQNHVCASPVSHTCHMRLRNKMQSVQPYRHGREVAAYAWRATSII